jgi:ABC-type antimicrobial peptide transport system permease subunit
LTRSLTAALTAINPDLTWTFRPLTEQIDGSITQERLTAFLAGSFGALALLLAAIGLYGVTAYSVVRRRTELGIRMALGAMPASVVRLVLSRVARLVALGVIVGTAGSLWLSRFVAALLYGVEPRDPVTLVGAIVVLATVASLAGWIPAWRASRIDPAAVLRDQ